MPTPIFIYGAEVVLSPPDLAVDVFERVNTILGWHQPSIVGGIKMWDCLTHNTVRRISPYGDGYLQIAPRSMVFHCLLKPLSAKQLEIFGRV